MKKYCWVKGMAALAAVTLISGCTSAEGASLYDRGLRLVEKMDAMAESESYWNMMTSSQETSEIIKEIGAGDYSSPRAVYEVRVSKETRELLVDFLGGESSFSQLPEEIREELDRRLASTIATRFSAMAGVETLAAVSVLSSSDHFIDSSLTEDRIYFYIYDNGYWGTVTFQPYEDGIVHASGLMVSSDIFDGTDGEELLKWFVEYGGLREEDISKVDFQ